MVADNGDWPVTDERGQAPDLVGGDNGQQAGAGPVRLVTLLLSALSAYGRRVDAEMAAAGFAGREFPETPVIRMCSDPEGITITEISKRLGITRQGASKIVGRLRERGYLLVTPSPTSGREKTVTLTTRAQEYLVQQRRAGEAAEAQLRAQLGGKAFEQLTETLGQLAEGQPDSMDAVIRRYTLKLHLPAAAGPGGHAAGPPDSHEPQDGCGLDREGGDGTPRP
jgi:DNA-binding MarR family transcriptional regulator